MVVKSFLQKESKEEGAELLDGEEISETEPDDEFDSDNDVDPSELLTELDGEIAIETVTAEVPREINPVLGGMVFLVGISEDDNDNKDARFLDAIGKALEYETSLQLSPF